MSPILVHVAENQALAEILKDVLVRNGIGAMVTHHPFPQDGRIEGSLECEVWIADENDLERARQIVQEFQQSPAQPTGWNWRCKQCGEEIEPQFTACWKCGASREG